MKNEFNDIARLVKKLKENDQSTFPHLYELTYQRIYFLCFSILKNKDDAQDAMQETYIKIIENISSLKDDKLFIAWSNKIAYSICIRMVTKDKTMILDNDSLETVTDDSESSNPYSLLEKSEKSQTLALLINELDPVLRSTLVFKYFNNLKVKQIAEIMDCPEGTVKSRLNTAKRLLNTMIKKDSKNDILFGSFGYFTLREAFSIYASSNTISPTAANVVFDELVLNYSMSSNLTFVPQPSAKAIKSSNMPIVAGGAVLSTSAIAISVTLLLTPPSISNIQVLNDDEGFVNTPVSITATIKSPINTISETYLISESGIKIDGTVDQDHNALFEVTENGIYTIYAVSSTNLTSTAQATVTSIDNTAPEILNFTYDYDKLTIELLDVGSDINYETIFGETLEGKIIYPTKLDVIGKTITFEHTQESFRLSLSDLSGNTSYFNVNIDID